MNIEERKKYYEENLDFHKKNLKEFAEYHVELMKKFNTMFEDCNKALPDMAQIEPMPIPSVEETYNYALEGLLKEYEYEEIQAQEVIDEIELKPYLDQIRNLDYENMMTLAIKDNKIIDYGIDKGDIALGCNTKGHEYKRIIETYKDGVKICLIHNHPRTVSAIPSPGDALSFKDTPNLYDWGVVTPFDYYSHKQNGDISKK